MPFPARPSDQNPFAWGGLHDDEPMFAQGVGAACPGRGGSLPRRRGTWIGPIRTKVKKEHSSMNARTWWIAGLLAMLAGPALADQPKLMVHT